MLEETAHDYAEYIKLDVSKNLEGVQNLIDSMLTRLEELSSVLQIVKSKNSECSSIVHSVVNDDIKNYRLEITTLAKKINTLELVLKKLTDNMLVLEKRVEKAEFDFGISNESKIKNFLSSFLRKSKDGPGSEVPTPQRVELQSIKEHFNTST